MSKVIIYGYESLGQKIATLLKNMEYEVIVVDFDDDNYIKSNVDGFSTFKKDLLKDEDLIKVGIKDEDLVAFYCVSSSENNNFFVTLSARNLNKNIKIISKSKSEQNSKKMLLAGANHILNPYKIGALKIFRMFEKPILSHLIYKIFFGNSNLNMEEFTIKEGSILDKKYLEDFDFSKEFNIIILGLVDKELGNDIIFNYNFARHKIDVGDTIVVIGHNDNLDKFNQYIKGD